VIVYGDGRQERDFTFVDDIARGTVAALRPLGYDVINLGGDHPAPLHAVIEHIEAMLGKPARIERRPESPADVRATWADVSKARRLLGWAPAVPLEAGLQACVDWYLAERAWARDVNTVD